ncbi:MAG TPA: helix-turn-helix domain-containing protein [Chloroflexi bacterium]|nr:helix-turn-helix domain-containing protein [Chloroflexota bacterium]
MNADNIASPDAQFLNDVGGLLLNRIRFMRIANGGGTAAGDCTAHSFGRYLRGLRAKAGLSRQDLAGQTALSEAQIAALENGFLPSGDISADLLRRLAVALDADVDEFNILLNRNVLTARVPDNETRLTRTALFIADAVFLSAMLLLLLFGDWAHWLRAPGVLITLAGGFLFLGFQKLAGDYWWKAGELGDQVLALPTSDARETALKRRNAAETRFQRTIMLTGLAIMLAVLPVYLPFWRGTMSVNQLLILPALVGGFLFVGYRVFAAAYQKETLRWRSKLGSLQRNEERQAARQNIAAARKLVQQSVQSAIGSVALLLAAVAFFKGGFSVSPFFFQIVVLATLYLLLRLAPRFVRGKYYVPLDLLHLQSGRM